MLHYLSSRVETIGLIDEESMKLSSAIGRHITEHTGKPREPRESQFLYQRLYIIIHCCNADSFKKEPSPDFCILDEDINMAYYIIVEN